MITFVGAVVAPTCAVSTATFHHAAVAGRDPLLSCAAAKPNEAGASVEVYEQLPVPLVGPANEEHRRVSRGHGERLYVLNYH